MTIENFALPTAAVADACMRLSLAIRAAPSELRAQFPTRPVSGRALCTKHYGSVDIFLEILEQAKAGDVLVVDNGGRKDEGCIGDLITLEAKNAGIAAIVIWGTHRDTQQLRQIGLPMFSLGSIPTGPARLDKRDADAFARATLGNIVVFPGDIVVADEDGVLAVEAANAERVMQLAKQIMEIEQGQARAMEKGDTLRDQLKFRDYLRAREKNSALTFRQHLQKIGGAVET